MISRTVKIYSILIFITSRLSITTREKIYIPTTVDTVDDVSMLAKRFRIKII